MGATDEGGENPICEVCKGQTKFFQDVAGPHGTISFYQCTREKCGYFTYIASDVICPKELWFGEKKES